MNLAHADIPMPVSFGWCVLEGGFDGHDCHIKELAFVISRTGPITLDLCRIDGSLNLGKTAADKLTASWAMIGGQLNLNGATLSNPDGNALRLDGADVRGGLYATDGFKAIGEFRALGATFGTMDLRGATLSNPNGDALSLDGADIKGGVFAEDGFNATGQVRAMDVTISGQLSLDGATISNPNENALSLDRAEIKGGVRAGNGFHATGQVRASGSTIGSELNLAGATLINASGAALVLDGADIKGDLFADDGFNATGEVRLLDATISGQLILDGATLSGADGNALGLHGADIKGGMFARDGFRATGEVNALGATVGGALRLRGASFSNPNGTALNLESADVSELRLDGIKGFDGHLDLTSCQIGDLVVGAQPQELPGLASGVGFRVRDVHGYLRSTPTAAITWLDTCARFTASPWEEFARVYDRNGQPADARRIRFAAAERTTRHAPWYSKPIRWFYKLTVGYGYYPLIAAAWLLGAVLLATFLTAANPDAFLPTAANARATSSASPGVTCPPTTGLLTAATDSRCRAAGYPELKPVTYALAAVSPASALAQPAWAPLAPGAAWLEVTLTALKLFGFLLTALLLAGLTGLLKRG